MKTVIQWFKGSVVQLLKGSLIGLGAVLPGMSGGVLCVVFGIYKTMMELLANPFKNFKTHVLKLLPYVIGAVVGFLLTAKLLSVLLERFEAPSVCLFVGLIAGTMPSLFREAGEQGRSKASYVSMFIAMITIFTLLITLTLFEVEIELNSVWSVFCGFCLALSVIAPGMSYSTLLMPLGLYDDFNGAIGNLLDFKFEFAILIPAGIGALVTVLLLARAVNTLFEKHYSVAFHAIIGIVIAATVMIIPFQSFAASVTGCVVNIICLAVGVVAALELDKFNRKYDK